MTMLTVTRKADRAKMVAIIRELAESLGATVDVEPEDPTRMFRRAWRLKISVPGGAYLPVSINGDSPHRPDPNVFVCTWNTELGSFFAFSGRMGDVNPYHFAKVTRVGYGLDHLCDILRRDIPLLLSGEGYSAERALKLAESRLKSLETAAAHYAPIVAAGLGTTNADCTVLIETPDQVRAKFECIPSRIAEVNAFIAAGCPMGRL